MPLAVCASLNVCWCNPFRFVHPARPFAPFCFPSCCRVTIPCTSFCPSTLSSRCAVRGEPSPAFSVATIIAHSRASVVYSLPACTPKEASYWQTYRRLIAPETLQLDALYARASLVCPCASAVDVLKHAAMSTPLPLSYSLSNFGVVGLVSHISLFLSLIGFDLCFVAVSAFVCCFPRVCFVFLCVYSSVTYADGLCPS